MEKWKKIGMAGVDSGELIICDPCYLNQKSVAKVFANGCGRQHKQLKFDAGHAGAGVAFSSGIGDGCYPVYARIEEVPGWGKRICEVRIDFEEHPVIKKKMTPADINKGKKK